LEILELKEIRDRINDFAYSMERQMDRLSAIEVFVRVVDTGSFSAVARLQNIGQPAVSKAVVQLEEWLGVSLLMRSTRSVTPTEAGRIFYERAKRMIEEANGAVVAARGKASGLSGKLRVSTAICFGRLHLIRFRRCRFSC
jgi:DNA-binding transcriptional LysR family regulator